MWSPFWHMPGSIPARRPALVTVAQMLNPIKTRIPYCSQRIWIGLFDFVDGKTWKFKAVYIWTELVVHNMHRPRDNTIVHGFHSRRKNLVPSLNCFYTDTSFY